MDEINQGNVNALEAARRARGFPAGPLGQAGASGLCPDCEYPLLDHLSADEAEDHGIDAGLRDGLGCAVVVRVNREAR